VWFFYGTNLIKCLSLSALPCPTFVPEKKNTIALFIKHAVHMKKLILYLDRMAALALLLVAMFVGTQTQNLAMLLKTCK
jgi:hypothetical protein